MKCELVTTRPKPPPPEYVLTMSEQEARALKRLCGFLNGYTGIEALRKAYPTHDLVDAEEMKQAAMEVVRNVPIHVGWDYR